MFRRLEPVHWLIATGVLVGAALITFVLAAVLGSGSDDDGEVEAVPTTAAAPDTTSATDPPTAAGGTTDDPPEPEPEAARVAVPVLEFRTTGAVEVGGRDVLGPTPALFDDPDFTADLAEADDPDEFVAAFNDAVEASADATTPRAFIAASRLPTIDETGRDDNGRDDPDEGDPDEGDPADAGDAAPVLATVDLLDVRVDPDDPDGPVAAEPAPDEPLLDVCADVEGWCDEGIGGTVVLALEFPIEILDVVPSSSFECWAAAGDGYAYDVITTRPGHVRSVVRTADGWGAGTGWVSTSDAEVARWEAERADGTDEVAARSCIGVPRPPRPVSEFLLIVEASREPDGEVEDRWSRWLAPLDVGGPPPVMVTTLNDRQVRVEIPTTAQWQTRMALIPMGDDDSPAVVCDRPEEQLTYRTDGRGIPWEDFPELGDFPEFEDFPRIFRYPPAERIPTTLDLSVFDPDYTHLEIHPTVTIGERTAMCIRWDQGHSRDSFDIRRRDAIYVEPPRLPEVTASVGNFVPLYRVGADGVGRAEVPPMVHVELGTELIRAGLCTATMTIEGIPETDRDPVTPTPQPWLEMCRFEATETHGQFVIATRRTEAGVRLTDDSLFVGVARPDFSVCVGVPSCQISQSVPVHRPARPDELLRRGAPGDTFSTRQVGKVTVVFGVTDAATWDDWYVADAEPFGEPVERPELPAMSEVATVLRTDESCIERDEPPRSSWVLEGSVCWARELVADWAADRPVRVVAAYVRTDDPLGSWDAGANRCRESVTSGGSPTDPLPNGTLRFRGLCPGTTYELGLVVEDPETGRRVRYSPRWTSSSENDFVNRLSELEAEGDVTFRAWNVAATTPTVPVTLDRWQVEIHGFETAMREFGDGNTLQKRIMRSEIRMAGQELLRVGEVHDRGACGDRVRFEGAGGTDDRSIRVNAGIESQILVETNVQFVTRCYIPNVVAAFGSGYEEVRRRTSQCRIVLPWDRLLGAALRGPDSVMGPVRCVVTRQNPDVPDGEPLFRLSTDLSLWFDDLPTRPPARSAGVVERSGPERLPDGVERAATE